MLTEQLRVEYPGLSLGLARADAALKLTKQNGEYCIYRATRILPGREGVSLVLESPTPERSGKHRTMEGNNSRSATVNSGNSDGESESSDGGSCDSISNYEANTQRGSCREILERHDNSYEKKTKTTKSKTFTDA